MLRPVLPGDTDALVRLASDTGFFKPLELHALREVLDDYHSSNAELGHVALAWEEQQGRIDGFVYYAPTPMTEGTWHLYWIAVRRESQGTGVGSRMLRLVEEGVRQRHGRLLLVETSSTPHYEPTRRFYSKHGYEQVAMIPDYYAEGDGMVVFSKRIR